MRKFIIAGLIAATAFPIAASAQSAGEARRSQQDVREDRRDLRDAQRTGDRRDVRDARGDLRDSRQEAREDWRDYRRTNGAAFRRPAYTAPVRNWRYRPVTVGYRFQPAFYGSRYVIGNPAQYRLPPAGRYNRWIRYGNDVVLVDGRGRAVRVYNSFFY